MNYFLKALFPQLRQNATEENMRRPSPTQMELWGEKSTGNIQNTFLTFKALYNDFWVVWY